MIRVERGAAPDFVLDSDFTEPQERYEVFRSLGGSRTKQTTMDVSTAMGAYLSRAAEYAAALFNSKCAYTEVVCPPQLLLHRPEGDAYDDRLGGSPNHYWWTAFWYRNWYHASAEVASLKRNLFPVIGERAIDPSGGVAGRYGEVGTGLLAPIVRPEQYLDRGVLLDPCEDHPQMHLLFDESGQVGAWADQSAPWLDAEDARRGRETIKLLDLNSERLVTARRDAIAAALHYPFTSLGMVGVLNDLTTPHLGALRQVVAAGLLTLTRDEPFRDSHLRGLAPELVPHLLATPGRFDDALVTDLRVALRESHPGLAELLATPAAELRGARPEDVPTATPAEVPPGPTRVIPVTAAITKITIKNFQAIEDYVLEVPSSIEVISPLDPVLAASKTGPPPTTQKVGPAGRPWRVFLGVNGSGKSSALRAMALALAGDRVEQLREQCGLTWTDLLRRGTTGGQVRLDFTGGDSVDLRFTADGPTRASMAALPQTQAFVRGFGATRLNSDPATGPADYVRLGNLFDPLQPVVDAQRWLVQLEKQPDQGDFNVAAVAIARLLDRQEQVAETGDPGAPRFLRRVGEEIWVADEPLRTLSDGYRAIISLACDLMAGAGSGLADMSYANGIVLIDELGCYLHPRWKMQITRTLREVFPSMQFFVTTHEPLCLRGLVEREVVRVTPSSSKLGEAWHAVFETVEESPSKYRVDRLLTSEFFGLDTTIDPDVQAQFDVYYALRRKVERTPQEESDLAELRAHLSQYGILGYTARDQLVYEAIDEFLSTSSAMTPEERRAARRATLGKVADIWRAVAAQREVRSQP